VPGLCVGVYFCAKYRVSWQAVTRVLERKQSRCVVPLLHVVAMACHGPGLNFAHVGAPESQRKCLPCHVKRSQSECCDRRAEGCDGQGSHLPPARPRRYYCGTQICRGVPLVRLVCSLHKIVANCSFSKESQLHILINNASVFVFGMGTREYD
jgi:hypothetical protein